MDGPTNPETLLISAVIQTGDFTTPGESGLTPECFHSFRPEWEWIEKFVTKRRKSPDKATFRAQFPDFRLLKTIDVDHGCEAVRQSHLRHMLTKSIKDATRLLVADRPEEALNKIHSSISGISQTTDTTARNVLTDYSKIFQEVARRVELANTSGLAGIDTGYVTLNERTGGLQPGGLWIMATRLGMGKSWSLCKMASAAVMNGRKVAFVTLEMPSSEIVFRMHTLLAHHYGYSLRHSALMYGKNLDLAGYRGFLASLPDKDGIGELGVFDPSRGQVSPYTLATIIETTQPDVVFVDYITLMKKKADWQGIAELSAETKEVALRYGVPIVCAAQINRMGVGGSKPPGVHQLSQGDTIGQDADVVVTGRKYSTAARQWLLAKNRQGQDDIVFYTSFDPDNGVMDEITYDEANRLAAEASIEDDE